MSIQERLIEWLYSYASREVNGGYFIPPKAFEKMIAELRNDIKPD
jgi:hypothetical protein